MQTTKFLVPITVVLLSALTGGTACVFAQEPLHAGGFISFKPADIKWVSSTAMPGLSAAKLIGDPEQPGPYVMRARFAPGVMTPPHTHTADRYVVVISGTWYVGTSENFDPGNTRGLPAGSLMKHPAGAVHYDGAKDEEVVVQISGMGPVKTEFIGKPEIPQ
ncbi:MAG: cupin domain-containing protein [Gammaproteobacteria bacterium]|nr:cupin domain-containing protein [Gammaproteobacteria bacterium]